MENTKYDDKFYRLPKRLFKDDQFRSMTNEAKSLYMILLDRRCLSECNGDAWIDEYGALFIIFTIKEMSRTAAVRKTIYRSIPNISSRTRLHIDITVCVPCSEITRSICPPVPYRAVPIRNNMPAALPTHTTLTSTRTKNRSRYNHSFFIGRMYSL